MLKKWHFEAINSCISGEIGARFQSKTYTIPLNNHSSIQNLVVLRDVTKNCV